MNEYLFKTVDMMLSVKKCIKFKNIHGRSGVTYDVLVVKTPKAEVWCPEPSEVIYTEFDKIREAYREQEYIRRCNQRKRKQNKRSILNILIGKEVA